MGTGSGQVKHNILFLIVASGFIDVCSRRATGFLSRAKLVELNFLVR